MRVVAPPMLPGLYAIVDTDSLARSGRAVLPFAQRVLAAGRLSALQLRAKSLGARETLELARALAPWCRAAEVPFFLNDRADLAWLASCDGVHVGTTDLAVEDARRVAPGLRVGASSHTPDELRAALSTDADYVAYGPVYGTTSKRDPSPTVGLEALREAAAMASLRDRPLVAIGGITVDNAREVRSAGATAGAVIAGLLVDDPEVTARARRLHLALGGD